MIDDQQRQDSTARVLVWDTSPLYHAMKADRIDVLADVATMGDCTACRNITTATVIEELRYHGLSTDDLGWIEIVHVDGLDELSALVRWMDRVSGDKSNQGEATVLAWAETHRATAVVDDQDARRAGRNGGLDVWGSLRVVAESVRNGQLTEYSANAFVDALIETGARYPCQRGQFTIWAKASGIL
ncbi:MAG TPA: hypothetical protein VG317_09275 [Pseudonocardiaceae bacterium]|jgi:predicted nucleic acid-binding protein|nr:hypothetical protein [Pseudonocardiaceae bacterium]